MSNMKWKTVFLKPIKEFIKYILRLVPDRIYLSIIYRIKIKKRLNLKKPCGFNEKLQWLKLHDHRTEYIAMVDKYAAKDYAKKIIGEEYIVPTLGVWEKFNDIDFDMLPDEFVLKCTHDSGGIVICKDKSKLDVTKAKEKIEKSLKRNFYWGYREWPYRFVQPRIIAEPLLKDIKSEDLKDYKLMCFNGQMKCSFICSDRNTSSKLKVTFFDKEWNVMPFERHYPKSKEKIEKPQNYELMIELAEKISKGYPFMRVDFYEVNGELFLGEITLYPGAGLEEFTPDKYDEILGSWIDLPRN